MIDIYNNEKEIGKKAEMLHSFSKILLGSKLAKFADGLVFGKKVYKTIYNINKNKNLKNFTDLELTDEIENAIEKYILKNKGISFVVRSSASCEDSILFSCSGQYESFMNLTEKQDIIDAFKRIYFSFWSTNAKIYSEIYNININKEYMAILMQPQIKVQQAGVAFSCNPVNKNKTYIIESNNGNGVKIVSGQDVDNRLELAYKDVKQYNGEFKNLIKIIKEIKKVVNFEVDLEWGIKNGELWVFQIRPIVFDNKKLTIDYKNSNKFLEGEIISKGLAIGRLKPHNEITTNCIIYSNEPLQANEVQKLLKCDGVVLKNNNKLSHLANICREFKKPCLFCDFGNLEMGKVYLLDGINGKLENFENLDEKEKSKILWFYVEHLIKNFNYKTYKYRNIKDACFTQRFEQVYFDLDNKKIKRKLEKLNFKKAVLNQKLQTFDFKDNTLIKNDIEFRINCDEESSRIQMKRFSCNGFRYRGEEDWIITFESKKDCEDFMANLGMIKTGGQERKIVRYKDEKQNLTIKFIEWPNSKEYFGIESESKNNIKNLAKVLGLNDKNSSNVNGVDIFEKLNLKLEECCFKKEKNEK